MSAPTVFISYSHQDKDLLKPLKAQLETLETAGLLEVWEDTRIDAGDKWYPEIEEAMKRAAVAVCLVSEYFPLIRLLHETRSTISFETCSR